ncbi:SH3 domain-containing protein [Pseudomonas chengduensis]|nr:MULTISPECIES: SH3 domain-containing protein [Pseudomonas]MAE21578.1 SH3 domain-containing protein [Pseudomonas sp.]APU32192.1 hypothetical protein UYA_21605 [Pseudomonas alcaliphila JAB1]MDH1214294.1 SH3 domain-containing protein [Pseudomonas chengduensis]MDH1281066.1 SH3 domain-containing protein [Pseudomonas chengduensis]MDH1684471.1 SH3 domain-containing protein [Pseudomonas chengduensis]
MTGKNKDRLKQLGVVSSSEELRELMATLKNPAYLADMREQMKALANPAYLVDMREQIKAIANPTYLADIQERMKALVNPTYLLDMQKQMKALANPAYLVDMQEQLKAIANPTYLAQMQEQLTALTNPSYLAQVREAASARMQADLSAALGSYQELVRESVLASYLVTPDDPSAVRFHLVDIEGFDSLEVGDFAELEIGPAKSVDLEIVKALADGHPETLSLPAKQRLQSVYLQIVAIWDMLLRIFNTFVAIGVLTALMSGATKPADVPKQAALLPNYERELLADSYRIVNRNGARLRAEPSKTAEVIVQLQLGLPVEVLENNGKGWFRVLAEYQGESVEGWIHLTVTTPVPLPKYPRGPVASATLQ